MIRDVYFPTSAVGLVDVLPGFLMGLACFLSRELNLMSLLLLVYHRRWIKSWTCIDTHVLRSQELWTLLNLVHEGHFQDKEGFVGEYGDLQVKALSSVTRIILFDLACCKQDRFTFNVQAAQCILKNSSDHLNGCFLRWAAAKGAFVTTLRCTDYCVDLFNHWNILFEIEKNHLMGR